MHRSIEHRVRISGTSCANRYHLGPAEHQRTMARRNGITRTGLMVLAATPAMVRDHPQDILNDLRLLPAGGPYGPWRRVELDRP